MTNPKTNIPPFMMRSFLGLLWISLLTTHGCATHSQTSNAEHHTTSTHPYPYHYVLVEDLSEDGIDLDSIVIAHANGEISPATTVEDFNSATPSDPKQVLGVSDSRCRTQNIVSLHGKRAGSYILVGFARNSSNETFQPEDRIIVSNLGSTMCGRLFPKDKPYQVSICMEKDLRTCIVIAPEQLGNNPIFVPYFTSDAKHPVQRSKPSPRPEPETQDPYRFIIIRDRSKPSSGPHKGTDLRAITVTTPNGHVMHATTVEDFDIDLQSRLPTRSDPNAALGSPSSNHTHISFGGHTPQTHYITFGFADAYTDGTFQPGSKITIHETNPQGDDSATEGYEVGVSVSKDPSTFTFISEVLQGTQTIQVP